MTPNNLVNHEIWEENKIRMKRKNPGIILETKKGKRFHVS